AREVAERNREKARQRVLEVDRRRALAEAEMQRYVAACTAAYHELEPSERCQVASPLPTDWLTTTYPGLTDLENLEEERTKLEFRLRTLDQAAQQRKARGGKAKQEREMLEREQREVRGKLDRVSSELNQVASNLEVFRHRQTDALAALPAA